MRNDGIEVYLFLHDHTESIIRADRGIINCVFQTIKGNRGLNLWLIPVQFGICLYAFKIENILKDLHLPAQLKEECFDQFPKHHNKK
jgi:hypothetical protein